MSRAARWLIVPGAVAGLLTTFLIGLRVTGLIQPFSTPSSGMAPAICRGDFIFAMRSWLAPNGITRGQIVAFDSAMAPLLPNLPHPNGYWLTRVAALPGDRFQIQDGRVWINGTLAPELRDHLYKTNPDAQSGSTTDFSKETLVPPGQYVVLGDNTQNSLDSRYWGFLPADAVKYIYLCHYLRNPDRSTEPHRQ